MPTLQQQKPSPLYLVIALHTSNKIAQKSIHILFSPYFRLFGDMRGGNSWIYTSTVLHYSGLITAVSGVPFFCSSTETFHRPKARIDFLGNVSTEGILSELLNRNLSRKTWLRQVSLLEKGTEKISSSLKVSLCNFKGKFWVGGGKFSLKALFVL